MEILLDWYKSAVVFAPIGKPHKIPNKNAEAPKGVREKTECQNFLKDTRSGSSRPEETKMEDNTIAGNKEGKSVENQSWMPKRAEEIQICGNNKEKRKQKRQKKEKNRRFINRFSDL